MLSEEVLCHEVVRVLDQKESKDHERFMCRQAALRRMEKTSYSSLQGVIKIPKTLDPTNSARICGYSEIKHEGRSRRKIDLEYSIL
jgi:hypothetical protein